jgi:hypothetical protein
MIRASSPLSFSLCVLSLSLFFVSHHQFLLFVLDDLHRVETTLRSWPVRPPSLSRSSAIMKSISTYENCVSW